MKALRWYATDLKEYSVGLLYVGVVRRNLENNCFQSHSEGLRVTIRSDDQVLAGYPVPPLNAV